MQVINCQTRRPSGLSEPEHGSGRFPRGAFDIGWPQVSAEEANRHIEQHRSTRPWLQAAERASPGSRRIMAAIDEGAGHGHIRHEGWVTEEANMRRAAYLEDPAQLDPAKRLRGIDGLKPDDKRHKCAELATRITDPDAFATAFTRGAEHPRVRAAIATPYDPGVWPGPILIPIADLLGKDGHKYCTGWQLEPADGSMDAAISNRRAWRTAMAEARQPDVPQPAARPVPTFEGGTLLFLVGHNQAHDGYEIVNMYPQPRDDDLLTSFASLPIGAAMRDFYWNRHPDGPFATLIRIATTYLHPEVDELEALQKLVKRENDEMHTFKGELRQAIKDPTQLPDDELSKHVRYEDGSPEAFLRRLWRDLYGEEPIDAPRYP